MARSKRGSRSQRRAEQAIGSEPTSSGGFMGQVGLFETANGLPHGPAAVALAILAALVIIPITRLVAMLRRR